MVDKYEFKSVMLKNRERQEDLAVGLGITPAALSNKINNKLEFKPSEIEKIILRYNLNAKDIQRIFFAGTVN